MKVWEVVYQCNTRSEEFAYRFVCVHLAHNRLWGTTGRGEFRKIQNRVCVASGCELGVLQYVVQNFLIAPDEHT